MNSIKKAYYHLPGLFEFYELYEAFLPIYREHREYFYDWCGIGSIYGAPADCIWGGGRIGSGEHGVQEVMNLMSEYGISARLTFSNSLLREEHLADEKCNALCKALNDSEGISNGVIVHSDILARYIKKHYPNLYLVSSTTKVLTDFNDFLNEVKREDFQYVVPDFRLNKVFDKLVKLTDKEKDKVEFLCNECCWFGCAARPYCDRAAAETGVRYELREEGDSLHILCRGKGAHASLPEEGVNAITGLLHLLCSLPLAKVGSTAALRALSALFPHGDCAGKALGIAQSDELSGALTLAFSLLTVNGTGLEGQFDSRVPICANDENCRAAAEASFSKFGFSVSGEMDAPHHTPADSPLVKALLKCYEQYTDYKGECLAIGGGTYVHDIPGGVAFGCCMPGFNGNMHGADEHTCIADQLTAAKIFTQAIIDLCG